MKKQWYRVKIKLDEINDAKSNMADIPVCSKKNETKMDQSKGVPTAAVKPPKNIERQIYIKYNQEIEKVILGGKCLSDMTINPAQSILHQQFPSVLGLEHTELGLTNMFTVRKNSFLEILYGNYHWVTAFGNEKGEISFYDSLSNGNIPRVFCTKYATLPNLPLTQYLLRYSQYNNNRTKLILESFLLLLLLSLHLVTIQH